MRMITTDRFLQLLHQRVAEAGSQRALAAALDVSDAYLSDVLARRRAPGQKLAAALGYKVIRAYLPDSA